MRRVLSIGIATFALAGGASDSIRFWPTPETAPGCAHSSGACVTLHAEAEEMLRTLHAADMLDPIDEALAWCPANLPLLRLRAFCLHFDWQYEASLSACKRALTLYPNDIPIRVLHVMALLKTDEHEAAADVLNALEYEAPGHALVRWGWACYFKLCYPPHYATCENQLSLALEDWPNEAHFFVLRSEVRFKQHDWEAALSDIDSALSLDSIWPSSLHPRRAQCLRRLGRYEEALTAIEEAIASDPKASYNQYLRGRILMNLGQLAAARTEFSARVRAVPCDEYAYAWRGSSYFHDEYFEESVEDCTTSIEIEPTNFAHMTRGSAYLWLSEYDKALEDFRAAYRLDSDDTNAYVDAAYVLDLKEDYEGAVEELTKASSIAPADRDIQTRLGQALTDAARHDEAIDTFTRMLAEKEESDALDRRGYAYWCKDMLDDAWRDFSRSIEVGPSAYAHFMRADILEQRGDIDGALEELKAAVAVDPEFEEAYDELIRITRDRGDLLEAVTWSARKDPLDPETFRAVALIFLLVLLVVCTVVAAIVGYIVYRFLRNQPRAVG